MKKVVFALLLVALAVSLLAQVSYLATIASAGPGCKKKCCCVRMEFDYKRQVWYCAEMACFYPCLPGPRPLCIVGNAI